MLGAEAGQVAAPVLLDAGVFIGALLKGDRRHAEARQVVERARRGELQACTTASILCEVYGALTWEKAEPRHQPAAAAEAVRLLVEPPSAITVLEEGLEVVHRALDLAVKHRLTARRIHDARHAAAALVAGIVAVCTYDPNDWRLFEDEGLRMIEPALIRQRS
ncbi:MAG: type II toxin-antitoxin system VapC family toxin [Candidatus Latescibacteria bacterium]|nr:type II toxin-antitoxin system VapC family toxin [Candidatus Latescibacterota bacterium]